MSGVWLPGSSIIIALFILIIFFLKERIKNEEVKIYGKLLIANALFCINATAVYIVSQLTNNKLIVGSMQRLHLSLLVLIGFFFIAYEIYISTFKKDNLKKILSKILFTVTVLLIIGIVVAPIEVIMYDEILDVGGASYRIAITGTIFYFLLMMVLNIKLFLSKKAKRDKTIPFFILFIMFAIGLILRVYFPEIITETFCTTIALLTMYFTIENPDLKTLEQVQLARDQAERANNAKSDFLSSMSHEIRTPLNAIVGFSEDIQSHKENVDPQIVEDANYIMEASKTLLEIVGNILDINKIESNKMEIVEKAYNYKNEISSLAKIDAIRIGEKPINFKVNFAPDIPFELIGDKSHIKEIINNLLTNAIKYTEEGEIELTTKCINRGNMCHLIITVRDTGRGIKAEDINRLFKKFERIDSDRNTTSEGTGLGLAITKSLVEMMGGKINVQSTFGKGSLFMVQIPQKIGTMTSPDYIPSVDNTVIEDTSCFNGKRVLIVDDNKLNIKVARRALQDFNLVIDECYDGAECIDKIKKGDEYDLILMDIMMPNVSGSSAMAKLKENPYFIIPTIALTADAIAGSKEKYLSLGFTDYIPKPFTKAEIQEKLNKLFNKNLVEGKDMFDNSVIDELSDMSKPLSEIDVKSE